MIQGGDFTQGNGRGGESIYGEKVRLLTWRASEYSFIAQASDTHFSAILYRVSKSLKMKTLN